MAVLIGEGRPPANEPAADAGRAPQFEIRKIEIADVMDCIAKGVQDFRRAPRYGMFFGAVYAIGGLVIVWVAFAMDYPYLAYPLMMGFALFAPFGGPRDFPRLESGEPLSWGGLGAVGPRGQGAWVSLVTLIIWLDLPFRVPDVYGVTFHPAAVVAIFSRRDDGSLSATRWERSSRCSSFRSPPFRRRYWLIVRWIS